MLTLAISLALASAPAPAVAGYYEAHQMELGAALDLGDGGKFRYVLDYGAVSEGAEGRWSVQDGSVRLTSGARPASMDPDRSNAVFAGELLVIDDGALVMKRYDREIRFERADH